jgi:predicted dehydrogenase
MRVGIVGCGLIGNKRLKAIGKDDKLVAAADSNLARAEQLVGSSGARASADWRDVVNHKDVELVVVATTNDMLAPVTLAAIQAGKHVLVEKPAARNAKEIEPVARAAQEAFEKSGLVIKVGFNHRFHPAFLKARELFEAGNLGEMMFIRGRYGQGGRLGMEKEWRGKKEIAGGGEMLDQGVHLIDLSRWFLGEFASVQGSVERFFWNWEVEDNGFALCKTREGKVAWLHASCTEWKNTFSFEIYGKDAKLHVEGLGGSYGVERLAYYKMLPQMGPPETTIFEYPGEDKSWQAEWRHTVRCIAEEKQPVGNMEDALQTLRLIDKLYARPTGPV